MRKIIKFIRLPFIEKKLLILSALLLVASKISLSLFSFKSLLNYIDSLKQKPESKKTYNISEEKIVWAVEVAGKYVPYATCLVRAITAQALLKKYGFSSDLRIGILKNDKGKIDAHAWIERHGKIIIGNLDDLSRFNAFPTLKN